MSRGDRPVVLITGASRGIGAAVAELLAREGYRLALTYRSDEGAARTVARNVQDAGGDVEILQADMAEPEEAARLIDLIGTKFGRLDHLVANAGIADDGAFLTFDEDRIQRTLATNLSGNIRLVCAAMPVMEQGGGSSIVLMSSLGGIYGGDGQVPYCASKGGLIGMMQMMSPTLAERGISINAVAPGYIETDMTSNISVERIRPFLKFSASGRMGHVEEIARVVRYLLHPGYINSTTIRCDGGFGR